MQRHSSRRRPVAGIITIIAAAWVLGASMTTAAVEMAQRDAVNPGLGAMPASLDLATPEGAWRSFLGACERDEFRLAAHCLDLTEVPDDQQATVGAEVAEQLYEVLRRTGQTDKPEARPPTGDGGEPADNVYVAARLEGGGLSGEVWLRRTLDRRNQETLWLVTHRTVSDVAGWFQTVVMGRDVEVKELNPGLGPAPEHVTRDNPRDAVVGFLQACRDGRFDVASHYLDLATTPADRQAGAGARLARRFKIVLDKTFWVNPEAISNDPGGLPEAGIGPDQDVLTTLEADGRDVAIVLRRHLLADGTRPWTFDPATVAAIEQLYAVHGFGWLGDHLPGLFFRSGPLEVQVWQWCAMLVLLIVGWALARLITPRIVGLLRRATRRTEADWDDDLVAAISGPLRLAILAGFLFLSVPWLHLASPALASLGLFGRVAAIIIVGWLLSQWVTLGATLLERSAVAEHNQVARSFVPIFSRIIKIGVWAVVAVVALGALGFEVMGLVAGLGIGGLAFAFAAQKSIENLFGAFAIAADRPFEVGNYVTVGGTSGTIEEVGLRSTRIRTAARTVVTIPNGKVMSEVTENYSVRDRILFKTTIGLLYSSTADQISYVIDETKRLLLNHPKVHHDVVRVRLDSFGDSAINVAILTWITTTDFNEYTAVKEELSFAILRIVEQAGTGFAFPSQTVYMAREGGVDEDRARQIETIVADRRANNDLWIPEAPESH